MPVWTRPTERDGRKPKLDQNLGRSRVTIRCPAPARQARRLAAWSLAFVGQDSRPVRSAAREALIPLITAIPASGGPAADDRMMGGRLLANMSHQANYLGRHDQAVQLARAAQEGSRGQVTATTMAMFLAMEARGHAGNGDDAACSQAFRDAERFFEHRDPADDPDWISYFDAAELAGEGAHCFRDLRSPRLTQEFIAGAVELCDPSYARTLAFVRLVHAASLVQQREPGQAVAVATEAIGLAGNLKSQRYLRYIRDLTADLDAFAGASEVGDFTRLVVATYPSIRAG